MSAEGAAPDRSLADQSDAVLISRVRDGDAAAYGLLYERHAAAARGLARQLIASEAAAEDAVSESFAKVLDVLRRGGGPQAGFRPYLLTSVRRTVYDHFRGERRVTPTDQIEAYDAGEPFVDPALSGLETNMIARAFRSLPERWQTVLWHTEIEGQKPADVGPLLGLSANGVAALAYRAREGLRQAYLQMHLAESARRECRPALDKLGAYVRGGLAKRESNQVERHLDDCDNCQAIYAELADVNSELRTVVAPLVLGTAATAYLSGAPGTTFGGVLGAWRNLPKRQQQALGAGAATVVAAAAVGLALVSHDQKKTRPARPPAAVPSAPTPQPPGPPKPRRSPQSTSPRPTPSVKPAVARPSPGPAVPAKLTAAINPAGTLVRDSDGIVALSVRNAGTRVSESMVADVALPPGVSFVAGRSGRTSALPTSPRAPGGGWICVPAERGATCAHDPVAPQATAAAYLRVNVAPDAPYGVPPRVLLRSYGVRVRARGADGVLAAGMPARYAADGRLDTVHAGNALLSCAERRPGCATARARKGERRDDDLWDMRPLDLDRDHTTKSSSSARVRLRGEVVWAGLYWSGVVRGGPVSARVRAPGAKAYTTVGAAAVDRTRLPAAAVYQAYADVTSLVRAHGGGQWWVADVPTKTGPRNYAGWGLVVVVRDTRAPLRQVMVLDGARGLGPETGGGRLAVPIAGLLAAAVPARLGVIGWEGDAELPGDRVLLDGSPLTPAAGDRDAANVFDGSARGAIGPALTFGTDVEEFAGRLDKDRVLTLTTGRDALLLGVVTVAAAMRS